MSCTCWGWFFHDFFTILCNTFIWILTVVKTNVSYIFTFDFLWTAMTFLFVDLLSDIKSPQTKPKILRFWLNCAIRILTNSFQINTIKDECMLIKLSHLINIWFASDFILQVIEFKGWTSCLHLDSEFFSFFDFVMSKRLVIFKQ